MQTQTLQDLGLSQTEAKVYIALLELGQAHVGEITKKSQVNRTNIYDALERLIKKGLATYVLTANRKLFSPVSPKQLKQILKEKEQTLDEILEDLEIKYNSTTSTEQATIFKGKKGIKSIFEDILKENSTILAYGAQSKFTEIFPDYHIHWNDRRAKLKLKIKMIYNRKVKQSKQEENLKLLEMKFLPGHYDFPSTIIIYDNKVATIAWTEQPIAFLIESKEVAKSNTNFFNILWKIAKP